VLDGRERDTHHAANGQTVPIHGMFKVGNSVCQFPGDDILPPEERCFCRCIALGAGFQDERKAMYVKRFLRVHNSLERRFVLSLVRHFAGVRARVLSHFPS
jgi:hypothetical protein